MDLNKIISDFFLHVDDNSIELYNEFSLQFELAIYLRERIGDQYKIQLERNVSFLGLNKTEFDKKEMDIIIFKDNDDYDDLYVLELKAMIDQKIARPINVYHWICDLKFLEQLKNKGIKGCFSIFVTNDARLMSGSDDNKLPLLPDFRNRRVNGTYFTHIDESKNRKSVTLDNEYQFSWTDIHSDLKYFVVEV